MTASHPVGETDLMHYVDGLLDPARRSEVEDFLARNPDAARRVADYRAQNAAIRQRFAAVADEPVPARLMAVLEERPRAAPPRLAAAAAVLALLLLSGFTGWMLGNESDDPGMAIEAFLPHLETEDELAAPTLVGTLPPVDWLSNSIALNLRQPDLTAEGFALERGDLMSVEGRSVVRLTYRDTQGTEGKRLRLFVATPRPAEQPKPRLERRDGMGLAYWKDGPLLFLLAGDVDESTLRAAAASIHRTARLRAPDMPATPVHNGQAAISPASLDGG
ncbi:anti-sigma factor [Telmatospirillum sp. J64-1]|uniref:anti-sigma factor family protein n=1 Tax=Telmatospirillum sp. J64-1 TaxID=2502183 RepID=UPI00115EA903|nr:anti-sigma factor [Telmatospirillum sp. J64-1]